jgi:hypothetical protein
MRKVSTLKLAVLLLCAPAFAQTINPNQIRPATLNGQVLTTVTANQPPSWQPEASTCTGTSGDLLYLDGTACTGDPGSTTDGQGNIKTVSHTTTSAGQGYSSWGCGAATIPGTDVTLPTDFSGFAAPTSCAIATFFQMPSTNPTAPSLMTFAVPTTVEGQSQSAQTWTLLSAFALLANSNTFSGTQTFNNLTVTGTCTGCGGGGGGGNYVNLCATVSLTTGATCSGGVISITSGTGLVTISGIPGTYVNLHMYISGATAGSGDTTIAMQFNGDTTSGDYSKARGSGSCPSSIAGMCVGNLGSSGNFGNGSIDILNYSGSTDKSITAVGSETQDPSAFYYGGAWFNTAAVTSITIFPASSTFGSGVTLTLYGTN